MNDSNVYIIGSNPDWEKEYEQREKELPEIISKTFHSFTDEDGVTWHFKKSDAMTEVIDSIKNIPPK